MRSVPFTNSIGAKLLAAYCLTTLLIAGLGLYSFDLLGRAGAIVTHTYDKPLMAINFARAASLDFVLMQKDVLRAQISPQDRPAIASNLKREANTFFADLGVAERRAAAADELHEISAIRKRAKLWLADYSDLRHLQPDAARRKLDRDILSHFDMLVELNADHSFVGRRRAVWAIRRYGYAIGITTGFALLLTALLAFLARRMIVGPLSAAAKSAERIGGGDLNTPVPHGGRDEAGVLLHTMAAMRENIRAMMEEEKSLRALAEIRLSDALQSASEGVILCADDGGIVIANAQASHFFPAAAQALAAGAAYVAALGSIQSELADDGGTPLAEALACAVDGGISIERQLKSGRWLRFVANRTRDGGTILLVNDYSQVKERELALTAARESAEAASASKSHFLATMSHELRTPLNAVIGFSELIKEQSFGPIGVAAYSDYAGDILSAGRKLLAIINNVLDLTKCQSGTLKVHSEHIDLGPLLTEAVEDAKSLTTSHALRLELPEPSPEVFADGRKLRQAIDNILSNAVKFTPAGGEVVVSVRAHADVTILIADTGIGMDEAGIAAALTPFDQVDARLQRRYEGIGLGLPLAKAFIDLQGGSLSIASNLGKGTCVTMRLPSRAPLMSAA